MSEKSLMNVISYKMQEFMFSSKYAVNVIFSNKEDKSTKCLSYLIKSAFNLSSAHTIYILNESIQNNELDELFNKADTFLDEITNNISTSHSHQWSDITYQDLKNAYFNSGICSNPSLFDD